MRDERRDQRRSERAKASTRQRRRTSSSLPAILVLGIFLALAGAVTMILSSSPPASKKTIQDEYAAALAQLKFPPGKTPRGNDPNAGQSGVAFNPAVGVIDAANAWFCAWAIEWRDTRGRDPAHATAALEELASAFPDGMFWRSLAKPDGLGLKSEVDAAMAGDGARLESEISAFGCET